MNSSDFTDTLINGARVSSVYYPFKYNHMAFGPNVECM